jgi:hypothetical protein
MKWTEEVPVNVAVARDEFPGRRGSYFVTPLGSGAFEFDEGS